VNKKTAIYNRLLDIIEESDVKRIRGLFKRKNMEFPEKYGISILNDKKVIVRLKFLKMRNGF